MEKQHNQFLQKQYNSRILIKQRGHSQLPIEVPSIYKIQRSEYTNLQETKKSKFMGNNINTQQISISLPNQQILNLKQKNKNQIMTEFNITQNKEKFSLKDIQMQLDKIIKEKISVLSQKIKKKPLMSKRLERKQALRINKQFQDLIKDIKTILKNNQHKIYTNQQSLIKWNEINDKIEVIQKIIAQGATELQIMKNNFSVILFQQKQQYRPNSTRNKQEFLLHKIIKSRQLSYNQQLTDKQHKIFSRIPLDSLNKVQYIPPNKQDYQKYRYQHPRYSLPNNYVPKSTYKRSFQKYTYPQQYYKNLTKSTERQSNHLNMSDSYRHQQSSYKKEFISKRFSTQNYRQLDCFKDKYKNLSINYIKDTNSQQKPNHNQISKLEKQLIQRMQIHRSKLQQRTDSQNYIHQNSSNRLDFIKIDQKDKSIYQSPPKNRRLSKLKDIYKTLINK